MNNERYIKKTEKTLKELEKEKGFIKKRLIVVKQEIFNRKVLLQQLIKGKNKKSV